MSLVAVLELPKNSVINLDGQEVSLQRDDFIGFSNFPSGLHFLTIRAAAGTTTNLSLSATVGFVLTFTPDSRATNVFVRRYDPQTEEVSPAPVDQLTTRNLLAQIESREIDQQRLVEYQQFISVERVNFWRSCSDYISLEVLSRRGVIPGEKLVPGALQDDRISNVNFNSVATVADGNSINFPPIPVLDASESMKRSSTHYGTKQFLSALPPTERSSFFLHTNPADKALGHVLHTCFEDRWEYLLGDLQLAYISFLHLQCYSSLIHWRDLLAMLSLVSASVMNSTYKQLYQGLLSVLSSQIKTMDQDFEKDVELSGGNSLLPSLGSILSKLSSVNDSTMNASVESFRRLLHSHFPTSFDVQNGPINRNCTSISFENDYEDDEPLVVVPHEEVEASLARDSERRKVAAVGLQPIDLSVKQKYPLLVAAMAPGEDIVMACARALDVASDVSLVREAAAYLEEVEAKKRG